MDERWCLQPLVLHNHQINITQSRWAWNRVRQFPSLSITDVTEWAAINDHKVVLLQHSTKNHQHHDQTIIQSHIGKLYTFYEFKDTKQINNSVGHRLPRLYCTCTLHVDWVSDSVNSAENVLVYGDSCLRCDCFRNIVSE